MSVPSFIDRGEGIEAVRWDSGKGVGFLRLNLQPAYPGDMEMAAYTREFIFLQGRKIIIRDHAVFASPRKLAWHFHGFHDEVISSKGSLSCLFGKDAGRLNIEANALMAELELTIQPTEVVYSYASAHGFRPFDHARFETKKPVTCASVEFSIRPEFNAKVSSPGFDLTL